MYRTFRLYGTSKIAFIDTFHVTEELAVETEVDVFSKKLQGEVMFKLLLHCIITHEENSLRTMESAYETLVFSFINNRNKQGNIRFSSIGTRLSFINVAYFEKLFKACVSAYKNQLGADKDSIIRFDSTIVALSTKLLKVGYQLKGGDAENYRQLKFTVGYADIPEMVNFIQTSNTTAKMSPFGKPSSNNRKIIWTVSRYLTGVLQYGVLMTHLPIKVSSLYQGSM